MISNNFQKIGCREVHIDEFPSDRIFVALESSFRKTLFTRIKKYPFEKFNQMHFNSELNPSTFKQWRYGQHFVPLWFLIKPSKIFEDLPITYLEKHIVAIKGQSSSGVIQNPKLPLLEDERLLKIVAHLLGDGSVGGGFGTKLPKGTQHSEYRNFKPELLESFKNDLSVFGEVPVTIDYRHGSLIIPNGIGYMLEHLYHIRFDTFNSRVPKAFFELSRELVASFLRAFGDDEGHVYDSSIEYYSNNCMLLSDILLLMNTKFQELDTSCIKANTKAGKNAKYYFTIYNNSQKDYLDLIGFDTNQKRDDLIFNINRKGSRNKNQKTEIVEILKRENLTAKQVSRRIGIRHSTVLRHLSHLKEKGNVAVVRKDGWTNVWCANSK